MGIFKLSLQVIKLLGKSEVVEKCYASGNKIGCRVLLSRLEVGDSHLRAAAEEMASALLHGFFYGGTERHILPASSSFDLDTRHQETPDNFVFSLKGSRLITHIKRLRS
jgi:hypothetical protein